MRAKFISETFSEKGDPIRDMGIGIGLADLIKDNASKDGRISSIEASIKYFGINSYTDEAYFIYQFLKHMESKIYYSDSTQIIPQSFINKCFKQSIEQYFPSSNINLMLIKKALKDFYNIDIT